MAWQTLRHFQVWSLEHLTKLTRESFQLRVFPTAGKDLLGVKYLLYTVFSLWPKAKPFIGQGKEKDDSSSPYSCWISMVTLLSKTIHTDWGKNRAVVQYLCIKVWSSCSPLFSVCFFFFFCLCRGRIAQTLLSPTGFTGCSLCLGWVWGLFSRSKSSFWECEAKGKLSYTSISFVFFFILYSFLLHEKKMQEKN